MLSIFNSALCQVYLFIGKEWLDFFATILGPMASVAIVISAVFAIFQWGKTKSLNGEKYIQQLRADLYNDREILETIYVFETNKEWYTSDFYKTDEIQRKIDKTLSLLEWACYLKENKYIDKKQFSIIQYQVEKTLSNYQVQVYLFQFYHGLSKHGLPKLFPCLIKYGMRRGLFDKSFKNINSSIYSQYQ